MKRLTSNKGFTLLEIMVTVSIMAIVLVSIFDLHSQTISMNIDAKFYATAPFLAQQKMSELEFGQFEDITEDSGNFDEDHPGFSWRADIEDIQTDALEAKGARFKKISITIGYNDDELIYDLHTYRFFYENQ